MTQHFPLILVTIAMALTAFLSYTFVVASQEFRTTSYLAKLLGEQYGFVREQFRVLYFIHPDGSAIITYAESFKATNTELPGIEHWSSVSSEPPLQGNFKISVHPTGKEAEIIPRVTLETSTKLYYQLLFAPPLKPGSSLQYKYDVAGPPGMFMVSSDEVSNRKLPFDYVAMEIAYPTNRLEMEVSFPPSVYPDRLKIDVWLGDARLPLKKELQRIEKEPSMKIERREEITVARFTVNYPILGLKYAITWMPIQRSPLQD